MTHLQALIAFWDRFNELKSQFEDTMLAPVTEYCYSITRLRQPELKEKIDKMMVEIKLKSDSTFDFTNVHDARENLFAYRLGAHNQNLLGFISSLPLLTDILRKICYLITKLAVEQE